MGDVLKCDDISYICSLMLSTCNKLTIGLFVTNKKLWNLTYFSGNSFNELWFYFGCNNKPSATTKPAIIKLTHSHSSKFCAP